MGYVEWIDCSPKAPLEQALYTVLIMWLAWQQAGGGWEPNIFSTFISFRAIAFLPRAPTPVYFTPGLCRSDMGVS